MILDNRGRPLRHAIGFIGGYRLARETRPAIDELCVVGFRLPLVEEADEEETKLEEGAAPLEVAEDLPLTNECGAND